ITSTPSIVDFVLVKTILRRFGSGLPIDSNVFLPITTALPVVSSLKYFKSFGKCHGIALLIPITLLLPIATSNEIIYYTSINEIHLYCDWCFNDWVRIVINNFKILHLKIKN